MYLGDERVHRVRVHSAEGLENGNRGLEGPFVPAQIVTAPEQVMHSGSDGQELINGSRNEKEREQQHVIEETAQNGRGVKRATQTVSGFLDCLAARIRDLYASKKAPGKAGAIACRFLNAAEKARLGQAG